MSRGPRSSRGVPRARTPSAATARRRRRIRRAASRPMRPARRGERGWAPRRLADSRRQRSRLVLPDCDGQSIPRRPKRGACASRAKTPGGTGTLPGPARRQRLGAPRGRRPLPGPRRKPLAGRRSSSTTRRRPAARVRGRARCAAVGATRGAAGEGRPTQSLPGGGEALRSRPLPRLPRSHQTPNCAARRGSARPGPREASRDRGPGWTWRDPRASTAQMRPKTTRGDGRTRHPRSAHPRPDPLRAPSRSRPRRPLGLVAALPLGESRRGRRDERSRTARAQTARPSHRQQGREQRTPNGRRATRCGTPRPRGRNRRSARRAARSAPRVARWQTAPGPTRDENAEQDPRERPRGRPSAPPPPPFPYSPPASPPPPLRRLLLLASSPPLPPTGRGDGREISRALRQARPAQPSCPSLRCLSQSPRPPPCRRRRSRRASRRGQGHRDLSLGRPWGATRASRAASKRSARIGSDFECTVDRGRVVAGHA